VNIPSSITTLLVGIAITVISLWYGQNHGLMPVAASEEATLIDGLFNAMMIVSTGLFLLVQGALIYSAFKFRRQPNDDSDGPYIEGNIPLEILWTAIPAVIVLGIAVYSFEVNTAIGGMSTGHNMAHKHTAQQVAQVSSAKAMPGTAYAANLAADPKAATPQPASTNPTGDLAQLPSQPITADSSPRMEIQATGLQYAWLFTYPDSGVVAGELHVPVGTHIHLNISANDVLHAFWVPEYRLKQDAIPGEPTELYFTPDTVGEYPVICAELCGPYHGAMKTKVVAESQADFDAWIASQVASADGYDRTVALASPGDRTPSQILAPFVQDLNITPDTLRTLHP
jgi:cytochrome c oxidase subunit II